MEGFASLAAHEGDGVDAARLLGAVHGLRRSTTWETGWPLASSLLGDTRRITEAAREMLGAERFAAEFDRGLAHDPGAAAFLGPDRELTPGTPRVSAAGARRQPDRSSSSSSPVSSETTCLRGDTQVDQGEEHGSHAQQDTHPIRTGPPLGWDRRPRRRRRRPRSMRQRRRQCHEQPQHHRVEPSRRARPRSRRRPQRPSTSPPTRRSARRCSSTRTGKRCTCSCRTARPPSPRYRHSSSRTGPP